MCRNIKTLFNFEPPATDEEVRAASLQFVRKLSGFNSPSKANEAAFDVTAVELEAYAPPSSRICMCTETSSPARVARCSQRMRAGWRCTCPKNDSSRL